MPAATHHDPHDSQASNHAPSSDPVDSGKPAQPRPAEEDQEFLDDLLDRALAAIEEGRPLSISEVSAEHLHLRAGIDATLRLAREIAVGDSPSTDSDDLPGVRGYSLLRELGRGGMGAVYLARQESLGGRLVALKTLPLSAATSSRARERFQNEANAVARLQHPGIVAVHDVVRDGATFAFAMDYVEGASLQSLIDAMRAVGGVAGAAGREPTVADVREHLNAAPEAFPVGGYATLICRWGIAIARALHEVHRAGLLHRDVKPSNILIRRDGAALLSDFGLVRDESSQIVTQGEHFVGTPAYASPEQLAAGTSHLDARSDLYGLGATLHHALALQTPFEGRSTVAILKEIEAGRRRPLTRINPNLPEDLETIVAKAMDPEPARRYQTGAELADDLERLLTLRPIHARPTSAVYVVRKFVARNRLLTAALAGIFLALFVGLIGTSIGLRRAVEARNLADLNAAKSEINEYIANIQASAATMREGDLPTAQMRLAAAAEKYRAWEWRYLTAQADQSVATLPPPPPVSDNGIGAVSGLALSGDGSRLAATWADSLAIFDARSGRQVCSRTSTDLDANFSEVSWSPDGRRLVVSLGHSNRFVVLDATDLQLIATLPSPRLEALCTAWSPDGRLLALGGGHWTGAKPEDRTCVIVDTATWEVRNTIRDLPGRIGRIVFTPDGSSLICGCTRGAVVVDLATQRATPIPIEPFSPDDGVRVAVSADGALLAASTRDGVKILERSTLRTVNSIGARGLHEVAFSPDSTCLYGGFADKLRVWDVRTALEVRSLRGCRGSIKFVVAGVRADRLWTGDSHGQLKQWSADAVGDVLEVRASDQAWPSPDFSIVMHAVADRSPDNFRNIVVRDGATGEVRETFRLDTPATAGNGLRFTPDGRFMVYHQNGPVISLVDVATREVRSVVIDSLTDDRGMIAIAADSTSIFNSTRGRIRRYSIPDLTEIALPPSIAAANLGPVTNWPDYIALSRDGRRVAISSPSGAVRIVEIASGQAIDTAFPQTRAVTAMQFSPDGRWLAVGRGVDRSVCLLDAATLREVARLDGLATWIRDICFDQSGERLFVTQQDGTVRIVGLFQLPDSLDPRFMEVLSLRVGDYWMEWLTMSDDGTRLYAVTVWPANRYFIWDTRSRSDVARSASQSQY